MVIIAGSWPGERSLARSSAAVVAVFPVRVPFFFFLSISISPFGFFSFFPASSRSKPFFPDTYRARHLARPSPCSISVSVPLRFRPSWLLAGRQSSAVGQSARRLARLARSRQRGSSHIPAPVTACTQPCLHSPSRVSSRPPRAPEYLVQPETRLITTPPPTPASHPDGTQPPPPQCGSSPS